MLIQQYTSNTFWRSRKEHAFSALRFASLFLVFLQDLASSLYWMTDKRRQGTLISPSKHKWISSPMSRYTDKEQSLFLQTNQTEQNLQWLDILFLCPVPQTQCHSSWIYIPLCSGWGIVKTWMSNIEVTSRKSKGTSAFSSSLVLKNEKKIYIDPLKQYNVKFLSITLVVDLWLEWKGLNQELVAFLLFLPNPYCIVLPILNTRIGCARRPSPFGVIHEICDNNCSGGDLSKCEGRALSSNSTWPHNLRCYKVQCSAGHTMWNGRWAVLCSP